jgi:hypothetical protein
MATETSRAERIRSRAVELGVYLPLGAYARVRDELTDLNRARLRKLLEGFVDRGQERMEPIEGLVRRRRGEVTREVARRTDDVKTTARKAAGRATAAADSVAPKLPRVAVPKKASELPIAGYASLTVSEITARLRGLTQTDLARVYKYERANDARTSLLDAVESRFVDLPIPTYDALTAEEIVERLDKLEGAELKTIRRYESDTKDRSTVIDRIDSLLG